MYTLELLTFRETDRKKHFFSNEPKKYREKKVSFSSCNKILFNWFDFQVEKKRHTF